MIFLVLIFLMQSTSINVYAVNNSSCFAKILFEQVYLYKTPTENNDASNIYFELPKSYFVELTSANGNFYKASYKNITGYVKKESVQAIVGTPKQPYMDVSFRVYAELSTKLNALPSPENTIINIPLLTKNITYYGKVNGNCLIEGRTSIWYYCKYSTDKDYYGYVYSDFCDEMPETLPLNTENVVYTNNPTFEVINQPVNSIPLTNNVVGIVIGILSIPALIFVFMIMKGTRILSHEKYKSKEVTDY